MAVRGTSRRVRIGGALAALAGVVALTAACSSDPDEASVAAARSSAYAALSSSSQAAVASSANRPPIPTAAQLDTQLKRALDPALPDSDRTNLIQDGAAFRSAIPDMYKALHEHPNAVYGVVDPVFDNHDGTLTATLRLDKDGSGENVRTTVMHFVDLDGTWKISRTDLCGILRSADYQTPACG
ncbi:hypothetical protein K7711_32550 [Nocardia sp. CA2R105]|uniref:hypothetical protein n=1 Tax=Nocardia coffeae TaxID=2873381 RepID=UPI001CA64A71|nr:hypothetical protein [Nocardia coffeae]MBY8861246.1 hypothetical protein [Nocardia coffeae]